MKYLLFGGEAYYPYGGWYDFRGCFGSIDEAMQNDDSDWAFMHVIERDSMKCVYSRGGTCYIPDGTIPPNRA